MALTESEKNELKKDILNSIKSESQSVDELAEVTSLFSCRGRSSRPPDQRSSSSCPRPQAWG